MTFLLNQRKIDQRWCRHENSCATYLKITQLQSDNFLVVEKPRRIVWVVKNHHQRQIKSFIITLFCFIFYFLQSPPSKLATPFNYRRRFESHNFISFHFNEWLKLVISYYFNLIFTQYLYMYIRFIYLQFICMRVTNKNKLLQAPHWTTAPFSLCHLIALHNAL